METASAKDNLRKIDELFECRVHPKYADGYAWFCKKCNLECNVGETEFECRHREIMPTYIICRYGCGAAWKLEICLSHNSGEFCH